MAWTTIPSTIIEVGDAIRKELWDLVKSNDDDHETRIDALELSAGKIPVFNEEYSGNFAEYGTTYLENVDIFRTFSDIAIVQAKITLTDSFSSAGTTAIDILKSTDGITYQTIFTTKPSLTGTSEGDTSTNAVVAPGSATISSGTYLKLEFDTLKTTQGKFHLDVYGEPA